MSKKLPKIEENFSDWYQNVIYASDMAEHSDVRGCMVIKPYGFSIWENIKEIFDRRFKETGHVNAYFPLFIPKSYLSKEAEHVEGFAKECAVVTHHRLRATADGKGVEVDPDARLSEELIVRPTSETIIWNTYKKWIKSHRDLPLLINQWANVVRWEMRPRLFLRTTEFLWQEGHTAHATQEEALAEARQMLEIYAEVVENYLAVPVIKGIKSPSERFAGAVETFTIEALMQDGKALQAGTSHFLGQNFAKAFEVTFLNKENKQEYVWATSWGVSTRLIGALIMTHGDNQGLRIPPRIAPVQVVMVPIYKGEEQREKVLSKLSEFKKILAAAGIRTYIDADDSKRPGWKFNEWELKGVPVRITLGFRDLEKNQVECFRRDTGEKLFLAEEHITAETIKKLLEEIQQNLYEQAKERMQKQSYEPENFEDFKQILDEQGGFLYAFWDGTEETERKIKEETKATIRCIPLPAAEVSEGKDIYSGKPAKYKVIYARAY